MNLPNYFLADLPPEAVLSPAMVAEACRTLKRNRARYLAQRSTDSLVGVLCDVAGAWLKPDNAFRRLALEPAGVQSRDARDCLDDTLKRELQPAGPEAGFPSWSSCQRSKRPPHARIFQNLRRVKTPAQPRQTKNSFRVQKSAKQADICRSGSVRL